MFLVILLISHNNEGLKLAIFPEIVHDNKLDM